MKARDVLHSTTYMSLLGVIDLSSEVIKQWRPNISDKNIESILKQYNDRNSLRKITKS